MKRKRIVSLLLALLMIFSMIPFSAFAESKVSDEEAAPFDETVEFSEDHPEAEIIVEDAEPDDLTAKAPEESAEEEQPTEESEDGLIEEENTEDADIEQDNSISDNSDPIEDEGEWADTEEEATAPEQPIDTEEEDALQEEEIEEQIEDDPVQEQPEPSVEYADPWDEAISLFGHSYGHTKGETSVYEGADLKGDPIFIISQEDGVLLATEYREQNSQKVLLVWCLSEDDIITGYVLCNALKDDVITDDADIAEFRLLYDAFPVRTNAGDLYAFHVEGYTPTQESEVTKDIPDDEKPDPYESTTSEEEVTDSELEGENDPLNEPDQEEAYSVPVGQIDDFIAVTTNTRAFMTMDESATDTYDGDYCLGYFVRDAVVQIAAIEQDEQGRAWYHVRYMFGDTYTDGSLKWTDYGFTWVLAQDTGETDAEACTVTDYALTAPPVKKKGMLKAATPTYGFSLRAAYGTMGSFYVGQYPLYGSSGSDSAYKQIAKLSGHGAVYATPHYLEGVPVYCLEHTYPGPGENKSSGGKQPTGPYIIVDIDSYMYNPGYSRIIYNKSTLHAIAWVLRHTYPFMVLDLYDADNDTWSRCAGQFAIREVIKQLEGPQYVRDYWDLNSFYTGSDQAPAEYLEYAKWLAYNGIARASITGYITEANKFMFTADGKYYGSVTLFTDADMIRIPCSVGSLTGNSLGSDGSYYYLNSGDTVVVASSVNGFSLYAESINSDAEEAGFMIGVPDAQIQKVLIPIYGAPYPMQGISLWFEEETQYGSLTITKVRDRGSMEALAGATFQLYDANGNAYGSPQTTGADGIVTWTQLPYGAYSVKETGAPTGYNVDLNQYQVTINGSNTLTVRDAPIIGSIQLVKKSKGTGIPLAGAEFELLTKSGNQYVRTVGADGNELPTVTTDAEGKAAWNNAVEYGEYFAHEIKAPEGYQLIEQYYAVGINQQAQVEIADAVDPIIQGKIRIVKTDADTGMALEGVEFTITQLSASPAHGKSEEGYFSATLTTNKDGIAETGWLDWGQYQITEIKGPAHYVDAHFSTTVDVTEHEKIYTVSVTNEQNKGYIHIVKTDAKNGTPLKGVVFDIYQGEKLIGSMTTDEKGVAVSDPLPKGRYTVKEYENPEGYVADLVSLDCEVRSDETTKLTADNMPIQFRVKIIKTDELTKEPLSGAEFTIKRTSGLLSHGGAGNGDVMATLTTDANGEAITDLLTWGEYEIVESKVPLHYVDNHFSTSVSGTEDQKTYEIRVENEPTKGWVQIIKTDALDRTPIEGVQFDIFYADEYGSGLAGTMITDKNGVAKSEPLRKGRYLVKEHADPTGYVTDLVSLNCMIRSDETTELNATNQPIQGRIKIIKADELTKEPLAGAEFIITRVSGLPSHKGSNDGEVVAVIATDAEGIALSPLLTWGTYRVEETSVPLHYVDNHFSTEVVINQENLKTYEVYCENEPIKGWIRLTKTDRKNGNPIAGVQFDLYYNDQYGEGLACSMVTDEGGIAMSEPIRKGQYIVKEHGETAGYVFEEVTLSCTVHSDEITDLNATNQPVQVKLKLFKRDKDEYTGNPADAPSTRGDGVLTGAAFQVLAGADIQDRQGNVIHEKGDVVIVSLKTAGEDASVLTDELWPGLYEIVELSPPTGYQPSEEHFFVDASDAALQSKEAIITYEGVKQNEILYGKHAIIKFLGDNLVHDDAGIVETPEPGAEFEVFLRSAGSYEAASDFERDYLTTNASGYAVTKLLPYGIYTLRQTKGADGYAIKSPMDIMITGTEDLSSPPITIINNEAINYRIKITKIDAESGQPVALANTGFRLLDRDGVAVEQTVHYPTVQTIDTFYTDDSGEVTLPETVTYGLYFIQESKAPSGYLIPDGELPIFVGDSSMRDPGEVYLLEYTMANEAVLGKIVLEKTGPQLVGFEAHTDTWGNEYQQPIYEERPLEGAVFEVYAAEDIIGHDGTAWFAKDELVDTIITTADGRNETRELPLGKYYLIETSAPEGYIFDDTRYEATLEYLDDTTPLVEVTVRTKNDYLPAEITLRKEKEILEVVHDKDSITQRIGVDAGEGFIFGLYCQDDIRYADGTQMADTLMATGITDANGMLTFTGMYPHGRYYIKEMAAAEGWKLSAEPFSVILSPDAKGSDNVIHAAVQEPIRNELIYTPVTLTKTDITGQQTIPGAQIEVRDSNGNVIYRAFTDENGEIPNIPVIPGTYFFKEILAPEGYALYETEMQFSVERDRNITGTTTVKDDYTRFTLVKKDAAGKPLAGVEFGLIKGVGAPLFTAVSDENGIVTFEKIPYGTYSVVETKPLPGYIPNETAIRVQIDGTFVNPEMPIATVVNEPNEVLVKKIDQDGNALAGATFALCDAFGNRTATAVSDQDGIVRFERIPYGEYTIRETIAPSGYLLSKDVIHLTVDADYRNTGEPIATVVNKLKNLPFIKQNTAGQPMAGVSFSLLNATNGEVKETVTSNSKGEFSFKNFDYGLWLVHENKAPDGYNLMPDYSVSVDGSWIEPSAVILTNLPDHYEFLKTDNEGNPMSGVRFKLEDSEGNVLQELVSGEDGMVYVTGLVPGSYVIRETETLEGFTVSDDPIEITIDDSYVVVDEIPVFVNYPVIQTGVDFEITPPMIAGAALIGAGGIGSVIMLLKRKKKHGKA